MSLQTPVQYPSEIILELTNACNLRCRYCHYHGQETRKKRPQGFMDRRIWEKVLDEMRTWAHPVTLVTHGAGEPLLYPGLEPLLRQAGRMPHVNTGFMTNGMLLDPKQIRMIMDTGVKWLALSIDGVIPETHDYYRVNARLKQIEANVYRLIAVKKQYENIVPVLQFNMVGYPEILDQSRAYVQKWLPHAGQVTVSTFRPVGSRHLWDGPALFSFRPCALLNRQMVISVDGQVGLCCEDIHLDVPLGNVLQQSLLDIFNSSRMLQRYRRDHEQENINGLNLCEDCHLWGGDIVLNRESFRLEDMTVEETTAPAYRQYRKLDP